MLTDAYGRVATDLRVSLTDRCNLRCAYCMPPEGLDWLPSPAVLTGDEIVRLVTIGVEALGIREVRFTGGEPLLRPDLADIIAATPPPPQATAGYLADQQRHRTEAARGGAEGGGPRPDQRLARHAATRGVPQADPPRPARRRAGRAGGRHRRRAGTGQGQRGADARPERRRGPRIAGLLPRARLRAAVHRADAARRAARLEEDGDGHLGRGSRLAFGRVPAFGRQRAPPGRRARR